MLARESQQQGKSRARTYIRTTMALLLIGVATKVLGFARDQGIAAVFGASHETDAFLVAYTLPNLIAGAIASAALTAFLPIYVQFRADGKGAEAWALAKRIFTGLTLGSVAIALMMVFAGRPAINLLAPGLSLEDKAVAVRLLGEMAPIVVLISAGGLLGALLNAHKIFSPVALAPALSNLTVAVMVWTLGAKLGWHVLSLGIGLGAVVQLAVQILPVRVARETGAADQAGVRQGTTKVLYLAWPVLLANAAGHLYVIVDRLLASRLAAGSIAALDFATKVTQLPVGLFAQALSTVIFPFLSEDAASHDHQRLSSTLGKALRATIILVVPAAVGLMLLQKPIIQVLFQRGRFDILATQRTADALAAYSLGLVPIALTVVLSRAFHALQNTLTPLLISLAGVALNIVLDVWLVGPMAHVGLALANSITSAAVALALVYALKRRLNNGFAKGIDLGFCARVGLATVAMAAAVVMLPTWLGRAMSAPGWALALTVFVAAVTYVVALLVLQVPDAVDFVETVAVRLGRVRTKWTS
ncbi:MAG: murein biosynthesis integral membrane protein MurJ [Symbiobacteriia bacterium]